MFRVVFRANIDVSFMVNFVVIAIIIGIYDDVKAIASRSMQKM